MYHNWPPQDQNFWQVNKNHLTPHCQHDMNVDVAVIGGGMAGLSAAHAFSKHHKKVVLLEQYYCGSGASGKSSGFITPNAELSLTDFSRKHGNKSAQQIWDFFTDGVETIRSNIIDHNFSCDYVDQDTLVVANSNHAFKELIAENEHLVSLGYESALYHPDVLEQHIGSTNYFGGVSYQNTFGINAYLYCQEMKQVLQKHDVAIFEETPVTAIDNHTLITPHARVTAEYIIICVDRFLPALNCLSQDVYHAQNFLLISQQLTPAEIQSLFPQKNLMVWDTDLIYTYFRLTGDYRLLLGGGSLLTTYRSQILHDYKPMITKLTTYFQKKFPQLNLQFEAVWPGLIGLSKDIRPIAGRDKERPFVYYITAAAGLHIAAALGTYSAQHLLEGRTDLDSYFSPYRSFFISGITQSLLGTKISFALSNLASKFF